MAKNKKSNKVETAKEVAAGGKTFCARRLRLGAWVLAAMFIFTVVKFGEQYIRIKDLQDELAVLQTSYDQEAANGKKLAAEKDLLNNPSYIEKLARRDLHMVKNGEFLVQPSEEGDAMPLSKEPINPDELH